jgi:hypothetical protein
MRRNRRHIKESATKAMGHLRSGEGIDGRNKTPDAAVEEQVIVALPVVEDAVNVIVLGAVKFWSGIPKLQVGTSTALGGVPLTAELKVTVPANPFAPVTVMRHVPDCPGAEIVIVAPLQPDDRLIPTLPTVTVTEDVVTLEL